MSMHASVTAPPFCDVVSPSVAVYRCTLYLIHVKFTDSLVAKDRLSDAGGLGFESHWAGYG